MQTAKTLEPITQLNHWSDLWLRPEKSAGYVAVTSDFKTSTWHGLKDKNRLIRETKGKPSQYISLNAFDEFNRKTERK